jgi:hypothetical protein
MQRYTYRMNSPHFSIGNTMTFKKRTLLSAIAVMCFSCLTARAEQTQVLFDFGKGFDVASVDSRDAKLKLGDSALQVVFGHSEKQPEIVLKAPNGSWNLLNFQDITVDVKNVGKQPVAIKCHVPNSASSDPQSGVTNGVEIAPGEKKTLSVAIGRRIPRNVRAQLTRMRGLPVQAWNSNICPAAIPQLTLFVESPSADSAVEISNVCAREVPESDAAIAEKDFFPMIDAYGQYIHKDWPNKIKSDQDLKMQREKEAADLAAHPTSPEWDQYGGWAKGPQLKASGFFRVEKYEGKWWMVDPEGHLFWAHCVDWVAPDGGLTVITDREKWFAGLPSKEPPFDKIYGKTDGGFFAPGTGGAPRTYETFNFSKSNLYKKYGDDWANEYAKSAYVRLSSWRLNAMAGGCKEMEKYKIPFTMQINMSGRPIPTSEGFWGNSADVFDKDFEPNAFNALKGAAANANNPWCIGYFIDNELGWGTEWSIAVAVLRAPADQPAKLVFIEDLKKKYNTIEKLNEAWGTQHASWDALLQSTTPPDKTKAKTDLLAFAKHYAERYFEIGRNGLKAAAPNLMYLGCRYATFGGYNEVSCRAAAKYCDIISFNYYKPSTAGLRLPKDVDMPILVSEFHFGALDRGMFHPGLVSVRDQNDRAKTYKNYVNGAIDNPAIVGTHWFMFGDEATTGFGNEENYQIGFVDVCDTPYPEFIQAAREVGDAMYHRRSGK